MIKKKQRRGGKTPLLILDERPVCRVWFCCVQTLIQTQEEKGMLSTQMIKRTMENLHEITKIDFAVYDMEGGCVSATWEQSAQLREVVQIMQQQLLQRP